MGGSMLPARVWRHRLAISSLIALTVPPAYVLWWPLVLVPLGALIFLRTLTALIAAGIGVAFLNPHLVWVAPALAGACIWVRRRYWPGALIDTTRSRFLTWGYLLRGWSWRGSGPLGPTIACEEAYVVTNYRSIVGAPVHNGWIYLLHRHGLIGVGLVLGAMGLITAAVYVNPWVGATLVVAAVLVTGGSHVSALMDWLRAYREGELFTMRHIELSIRLYLDSTGKVHTFQSKYLTRTGKVGCVKMLTKVASGLMEKYGITQEEIDNLRIPVSDAEIPL